MVLIIPLILLGSGALAQSGTSIVPQPAPDGIRWDVRAPYDGATLIVVGPDGQVTTETFAAGEPLLFSLQDGEYADGAYQYELRLNGLRGEDDQLLPVVAGDFTVQDGAILSGGTEEAEEAGLAGAKPLDVVYNDDLIVESSLCVGFDCVNGEVFGFDTFRLKENNLRIHFDDTSTAGAFPRNDWRIIANDSANGGASYLAIEDATAGRVPLRIDAGAPAHALRISSTGRVGIGTSIPLTRLHLRDGDTPAIRLDQDSTLGYPAQIWDVAGNNLNFAVRDVTNGVLLPLRIEPGTPNNALTLKANGNVGLGTWAPGFPLEIETNGSDAALVADRTDGATAIVRAGENAVEIGSLSNHPLRLVVNGTPVAELDADGNLTLAGGVNADSTLSGGAESDALAARIRELEAQNAELERRLSELETLLRRPAESRTSR
jgi:hypothetical protein